MAVAGRRARRWRRPRHRRVPGAPDACGPALRFWHELAVTAWHICEGPYARTDLAGPPGLRPLRRRAPWGKTALNPGVGPAMTVTLLFLPDCPNWRLADERLREALALAGRDDVRVEHRLVATAEQAAAVGFRGSPTVLVDGRDPFAEPDSPIGLSCRVYRSGNGLAGSPTVAQLLAVLR